MYSLLDLSKKYTRDDVQVYLHSDTKKIALIENEYGIIYVPKPVNWSQKLDEADRLGENGTVQLDSGFESIYKDKPITKPIYMIVDGEEFIVHNYAFEKFRLENKKLLESGLPPKNLKDIMLKVKIPPHMMNTYNLYSYFENIDIETVNLAHYGVVRNEMIKRNLIEGELLKLTSYQDALKFECEEVF